MECNKEPVLDSKELEDMEINMEEACKCNEVDITKCKCKEAAMECNKEARTNKFVPSDRESSCNRCEPEAAVRKVQA